MGRKNPDNRPLRIVREDTPAGQTPLTDSVYARDLATLALAQATLVKAGKDSAMPHFIACVKELERLYRFRFEQIQEPEVDLNAEMVVQEQYMAWLQANYPDYESWSTDDARWIKARHEWGEM